MFTSVCDAQYSLAKLVMGSFTMSSIVGILSFPTFLDFFLFITVFAMMSDRPPSSHNHPFRNSAHNHPFFEICVGGFLKPLIGGLEQFVANFAPISEIILNDLVAGSFAQTNRHSSSDITCQSCTYFRLGRR